MGKVMDPLPKTIEERVARLEKRSHGAAALSRRIDKLAAVLETIDVDQADALSTQVHKRMLALNRRTQVDVLKLTVLTELSFYAKRYMEADANRIRELIIRAMDQGDDWWSERRELTICNWLDAVQAVDPAGEVDSGRVLELVK